MVLCMCCGLRMRVVDARVATFTSRMHALALLTNSFRGDPRKVAVWHRANEVVLEPRQWSAKQQDFLNFVADRICVRDASDMAGGLKRFPNITGGPGTGKKRSHYPRSLSCCRDWCSGFNLMPHRCTCACL